jgi:hypothetical protein
VEFLSIFLVIPNGYLNIFCWWPNGGNVGCLLLFDNAFLGLVVRLLV